ncbi:MAG: chromosome partitioning protein [Treponema sp.]|jgi:phage shock protein A|nr:chromosome partitioning protein [Treponema sp.]
METTENLDGLDAAGVKEFIYAYISTLKLTEKKIRALEEDLNKWASRIELARAGNHADLAAEAEKETEKIREQKQALSAETEILKGQIEEIRKKLPLIAARERSIDPDLLEQELLMATGRLPGEEDKARTERLFKDMEKENAADIALAELKAKMGGQ